MFFPPEQNCDSMCNPAVGGVLAASYNQPYWGEAKKLLRGGQSRAGSIAIRGSLYLSLYLCIFEANLAVDQLQLDRTRDLHTVLLLHSITRLEMGSGWNIGSDVNSNQNGMKFTESYAGLISPWLFCGVGLDLIGVLMTVGKVMEMIVWSAPVTGQ